MNYIALINSFWDSAILNPLSTGQVSLYFALLHINNRSNWTEWFTVPNQVLSIYSGLSRSGISKARNELKQKGLIDFRERGTKATAYKITIANSVQVSTQDSAQNRNQNSAQDGVQNSSTLDKHKQTLKKKDTNVSKESYFPDDEKLNQVFMDFVDMRKKMKNGAMTERAISMMINKIHGLDRDTAIAQLEQSIVNNWKDIYPIKEKEQGNGKTGSPNKFHNFEQRDTDYDALAMEFWKKEKEE